MSSDPASFLPLTVPTFYILLSLAPGKKHGYAILGDVSSLSQGQVQLSTSTLYSALSRLLDKGLINRVSGESEAVAHPGLPRKAYTLSELGRRVLEAETERLDGLVSSAKLRLWGETV
jgi:DNA-binding PadR family transcriptional regulator